MRTLANDVGLKGQEGPLDRLHIVHYLLQLILAMNKTTL